jgi:hypothetical protein
MLSSILIVAPPVEQWAWATILVEDHAETVATVAAAPLRHGWLRLVQVNPGGAHVDVDRLRLGGNSCKSTLLPVSKVAFWVYLTQKCKREDGV